MRSPNALMYNNRSDHAIVTAPRNGETNNKNNIAIFSSTKRLTIRERAPFSCTYCYVQPCHVYAAIRKKEAEGKNEQQITNTLFMGQLSI